MNNKANEKMSIVLAGGLTGGPVMPLFAIAEHSEKRKIYGELRISVFDVNNSIAQKICSGKNIAFYNILAAKLPRYFSLALAAAPIKFIISFIQSFIKLKKIKPDLIIGAGGFVQVPVVIAGYALGIPSIIHQQDIVPSLANKLAAPFATKITTTFEKSVKDFATGLGFNFEKENYKTEWIGNPFLKANSNKSALDVLKDFGFNQEWPTLFVTGGGSGAVGLNEQIEACAPELLKSYQIIHQTGAGKRSKILHDRYVQVEFVENFSEVLAAADIVIARAGIGTLTELAAHKKTAIIIPMPQTHQEANAEYLHNRQAAIYLPQKNTAEKLPKLIKRLLFDRQAVKMLQDNIGQILPSGAVEKFVKVIEKVLNYKYGSKF